MGKKRFGLIMTGSIAVFFLLFFTMFLTLAFTFVLLYLRVIQSPSRTVMLLGFAVSSIVLGTLISTVAGQKAMAPILEISAATKEIAKGNFNITLKKHSRAEEIDEMARNFLLMARELANTETFRNDFISNVSHEFKTPLSTIEGYATLLQNPSLSPEKREIYVSKILYNVKRLSGLSGNILQLSKLEHQEIAPQKAVFPLDEQIRQIILLFEDTWTQKNLELDVDLDEVNYAGNSELLAQVWQNLIGNAVKFTPNGGSIRVQLRKAPGQVRFYLTDSGIGMDEQTQKRIFEKFYQGDVSHST